MLHGFFTGKSSLHTTSLVQSGRLIIMFFLIRRIEDASEYVVLNRNPLYDINATYTIIASDLPSYTVFNCSLSIPEVNWTQSKTLSYAKAGE